MQNTAVNAPITFEEMVMVMINTDIANLNYRSVFAGIIQKKLPVKVKKKILLKNY